MTKLPKKRLKKPSAAVQRKRLIAACDKLWSQVVHKIWKNKCAWPGCDKTTSLSAHHFFGKKAYGFIARYETDNSCLLCYYHHIGRVHQQGDVEPVREAIIQRIGQERFDGMKIMVGATWIIKVDELQELKWQLEALLLKEF